MEIYSRILACKYIQIYIPALYIDAWNTAHFHVMVILRCCLSPK